MNHRSSVGWFIKICQIFISNRSTISDLTNHKIKPGAGIRERQHLENVYRLPHFVRAHQEPAHRLQFFFTCPVSFSCFCDFLLFLPKIRMGAPTTPPLDLFPLAKLFSLSSCLIFAYEPKFKREVGCMVLV